LGRLPMRKSDAHAMRKGAFQLWGKEKIIV
jgi:hypothetical protein